MEAMEQEQHEATVEILDGSDFEDEDAKVDAKVVTLKEICETPGQVDAKTITVIATLAEIDDAKDTQFGRVQNMMLSDEEGFRVRLTIWKDIVNQLADFGPQLYSTVELKNVVWTTTPSDKIAFNHGSSPHELEFLGSSTIRCLKAQDLKSILFEKIDNLSSNYLYKTISLRGKVTNITRNTVRRDNTEWISVILEQGNKKQIEVAFFGQTTKQVKFKVDQRIAIIGAKFGIYKQKFQIKPNTFTQIVM